MLKINNMHCSSTRTNHGSYAIMTCHCVAPSSSFDHYHQVTAADQEDSFIKHDLYCHLLKQKGIPVHLDIPNSRQLSTLHVCCLQSTNGMR